jgi:hypothetical protein
VESGKQAFSENMLYHVQHNTGGRSVSLLSRVSTTPERPSESGPPAEGRLPSIPGHGSGITVISSRTNFSTRVTVTTIDPSVVARAGGLIASIFAEAKRVTSVKTMSIGKLDTRQEVTAIVVCQGTCYERRNLELEPLTPEEPRDASEVG